MHPTLPSIRRNRCLLVLALTLVASLPSLAQTESATLSGTVMDATGAVVAEAQVQVTNSDTNVNVSTATNHAGVYIVPALRPGRYRVVVSKQGFKQVVLTDVVLNVQDVMSRNFTLEVGAASESVTVTAEGIAVNTADAAVSTVVDRQFVANIPLNGRSFQDLISMTPGVVTQNPNSSGGRQGGDFSVNGQRTEGNYYTVDGVSANIGAGGGLGSFVGANNGASGSLAGATVLGTTQTLVSVDALQEFRVQSSSYSAEYGRAPGGQFSLVTRSGTNNVHGTLYDYFRNDFFDANDWFNNRLGKPISPLRQNLFGGTLGGPLLIPHLYSGKDKTFFFFSYEGLRLVQPQAATTAQLVPDIFMRQQAAPAIRPILNAYALPNGKDFGTAAAPNLAQFIQPFSLPSQIDATSARIDHTFGPKLTVFFRFADTPSFAQTRGGAGSASVLTTTSINAQTYTLGAVSQISTRSNNDFRLGYVISDAKVSGALDNFGGATPIDLNAALGGGPGSAPSPTMQMSIPGVGLSLLRANNGGNRLRQWNVVDTFSRAFGHHLIKVGVDYRRIVSPNSPPAPLITGVFQNVQQVLTNTPFIVGVSNPLSGTPIFNEMSVFVQDQWRVTPRLTLSLGLRWEVDPAPHGTDGKDPYTLLGSVANLSSLTLAPRGTPLWDTTWYNFAPRLGAAWVVHNSSGRETVIRAGSGVFFDTNNQTASQGFSGLGFVATAQYSGASLPITPAQANIVPSTKTPFNANVYLFPHHLQLPYTLEWNVSLQQALGTKQGITISHVGSAARRLTAQQQISASVNPTFGSNLVYFTSKLTADYDALQLQFQRSVTQGIHALASYTWSHCLDMGSSYGATSTAPGINQYAYLRGNCSMDIRHNFEAGASWDTPRMNGNPLLRALANDWGLDGRLFARTGFPVNINGNTLVDPATRIFYTSGVNVVPGQPVYIYGSQYPGGRSINPAAFALPTGSNMGNAPRNFARALGAWQMNIAVRREFPVGERLHLQFRAEAFNVFNHPNFGLVDNSRTSATFGQATSMLNQGISQLAAQYQQGGPRSMEFALKLVF